MSELGKKIQALGAASVCWEDPSNAGVFQDQKAKEIGNELVAWIEQNAQPRGPVRPEPNSPRKIPVLVMKHECEPSELIVSNRNRRCWCGKVWSWDGQRVLPEYGT